MNSTQVTNPVNNTQTKKTTKQPIFYIALFCFFAGVAVSMLYQLTTLEPRNLSIFDSRKYIETARLLGLQIENVFLFMQGQALHHIDYWFTEYIMFDGPTLSLVPAVIFTILGKTPTPLDWTTFALIQSVYHGLTAAFVFLITMKVTASKKWSVAASIGWILCPAAIIASSRFLTEGLSVFLMTAVIYFLAVVHKTLDASKAKQLFSSLLCGFFQGVLFLTKPALGPACLLATLVTWGFMGKVKKLPVFVSAIGLAIGLSIVMVPWLATTKTLTGEFSLSPKRVPLHNLAKGMDWESDGYETYSKAPIPVIFCGADNKLTDSAGVKPVMLGLLMHNPQEITGLFFRKITRLFLYPWNSFSNTVFGINPQMQIGLHWILMMLGTIGTLLFVCGEATKSKQDQKEDSELTAKSVVGWTLVMFLCGHFIFLPFETMARYGFTAIPIAIIFAVLLLNWSSRLNLKEKLCLLGAQAFAIAISVVSLLPITVSLTGSFDAGVWLEFGIRLTVWAMFIAFLYLTVGARKILPLRANLTFGALSSVLFFVLLASSVYSLKTSEWECQIEPGNSLTRTVSLPQSTREPTSAFLLVDGDKGLLSSQLSVNGHKLTGDLDPILSRTPKYYGVNFWMRTTTNPRQQYGEDVRGWRVTEVPLSALKFGSENVLSVSAKNSPVTVYGDYESQSQARRHVPEYFRFSTAFIQDNPSSFEGRTRSRVGVKIKPNSSKLIDNSVEANKDLSPAFGMQSGEYRLLLVLGYGPQLKKQNELSSKPWRKQLTVSDFNAFLNPKAFMKVENPTGTKLITSPYILKHGPGISTSVKLPSELKESLKASSVVKVKLSGLVKSTSDKTVTVGPALYMESKYLNKAFPNNPPYVKATDSWQEFSIEEKIPTKAIPLGLTGVNVALYPGPWEQVSEYGCGALSGQALFDKLVLEVSPLADKIFPEEEGRATY